MQIEVGPLMAVEHALATTLCDWSEIAGADQIDHRLVSFLAKSVGGTETSITALRERNILFYNEGARKYILIPNARRQINGRKVEGTEVVKEIPPGGLARLWSQIEEDSSILARLEPAMLAEPEPWTPSEADLTHMLVGDIIDNATGMFHDLFGHDPKRLRKEVGLAAVRKHARAQVRKGIGVLDLEEVLTTITPPYKDRKSAVCGLQFLAAHGWLVIRSDHMFAVTRAGIDAAFMKQK